MDTAASGPNSPVTGSGPARWSVRKIMAANGMTPCHPGKKVRTTVQAADLPGRPGQAPQECHCRRAGSDMGR